jgi:uncharacterized protein (TIGR02453 family)
VSFGGFHRDFSRFLRELKANNSLEWFEANKARYEQRVRGPTLAFIEAMAPRLERISPYIVADAGKTGGSMMRIFRDTRFSPDKSPYKTHVGVCFAHERAEDVHCPALWFQVNPASVMLAAGIWRPGAVALGRIRAAIAARPGEWLAVRADGRLRAVFGDVTGTALKRPPRGFAGEHPCIEDIKRKEFLAVAMMKPAFLLRADLLDEAEAIFAAADPLVRFLCRALGLKY